MTHKCLVFVISCLTCFPLISCQHNIKRQLYQAELLLDNHPDSALSILSNIETESVANKRVLAHYALLMSAALDKNYIDVENDSLISVALEYYKRHENRNNEMRSLYYYGVVKMNAQDYTAAIVSFERAGQLAIPLNNLRYLGLAHRNMGRIFHTTCNFVEAQKHNRLAIKAFDSNHDTIYVDYAKYSLATDYLSNQQIDSSQLLLSDLRQNSRLAVLRHYADICYANTLVINGDSLLEAIDIYRKTPKKYFSPTHYCYCANAFAKLSQLDSARKWMNLGYKAAKSKTDSARLHSFVYNIDLLEGNPGIALAKVTEAMAVQDSATRQTLLQSLSIAQKDYYQQEAAIQESRAQKQMMILILGSIIFIMALLTAILLMTKYNKEKESQLKEQMAQLALLFNNLQKDRGEIVGTVFLERIARLAGLSGNYFFYDDASEQSEALEAIKKAAREIKQNPSLFLELEDALNKRCHGIMEKLTSQVPSIKGENRTIISLFFAGIPDKVVQLIMGRISTGSLKTLRSRFRTMIKAANAQDEALFLEMLKK